MATTHQAAQSLADADESETAERYQRLREFGEVIADARRRAETMSRLELQLQLPDKA